MTTAALGGATGTVLLLVAPEAVFDAVVPFLVLVAVGLLAVQPRVAARVRRRAEDRATERAAAGRAARADHAGLALHASTFAAATYGGYFGGGLGVILLAVLGIFLPDDLSRLNGLKNALSLVVNTAALVGFGLFGPVAWAAVAVVGPASLVGGIGGSRLARRLPAHGAAAGRHRVGHGGGRPAARGLSRPDGSGPTAGPAGIRSACDGPVGTVADHDDV